MAAPVTLQARAAPSAARFRNAHTFPTIRGWSSV